MNTNDPRSVRDREELAKFARALSQELNQRPETWENSSLESFLEAMSAWIKDMDGYYRNKGETVPTQPTWSTFAEILAAARVYE